LGESENSRIPRADAQFRRSAKAVFLPFGLIIDVTGSIR
jgi:hypothetical protein